MSSTFNDELIEIQITNVIETPPATTFAEGLRVAIFQLPGAGDYPEAAEALYTALISHPEMEALLQQFPGKTSVDELSAKVEELLSELLSQSITAALDNADFEPTDNAKSDAYLRGIWEAIAPLYPEEKRVIVRDWILPPPSDPNLRAFKDTYDLRDISSVDEKIAWDQFTAGVKHIILTDTKYHLTSFELMFINFDPEPFGIDMDTVDKLVSWRPVAEAEAIATLRQSLANLTTMKIGNQIVPAPLKKHFECFLTKMEERQTSLWDIWVGYFGEEDSKNNPDTLDIIQDRIAQGLTPLEFLWRLQIETALYQSENILAPAVGVISTDAKDFLQTVPRDLAIQGMLEGLKIAQIGTDLESALREDFWSAVLGIAVGMGWQLAESYLLALVLAVSLQPGIVMFVANPFLEVGPMELVEIARGAVQDASIGIAEAFGADINEDAFEKGFRGGQFSMGVSQTVIAAFAPFTPGTGIDTPIKYPTKPVIKDIEVFNSGPLGLGDVAITKMAKMAVAPAITWKATVVTTRGALAMGAFALMTSSPPTPPEKYRLPDSGYTGGRTEEALEDLATDYAEKGGKIDEKSLQECKVGLSLEEQGKLKKLIRRDHSPAGEFYDGDGQLWDIKSYDSRYSNGFEVKRAIAQIQGEFNSRENVILNTVNLSAADKLILENAIATEGLDTTRILWWP